MTQGGIGVPTGEDADDEFLSVRGGRDAASGGTGGIHQCSPKPRLTALVGATRATRPSGYPVLRYFGTWGSESDLTASAGDHDRGFFRNPCSSGLPDRSGVSY